MLKEQNKITKRYHYSCVDLSQVRNIINMDTLRLEDYYLILK